MRCPWFPVHKTGDRPLLTITVSTLCILFFGAFCVPTVENSTPMSNFCAPMELNVIYKKSKRSQSSNDPVLCHYVVCAPTGRFCVPTVVNCTPMIHFYAPTVYIYFRLFSLQRWTRLSWYYITRCI